MLYLETDQTRIEQVLFSECPQASVGIRMKMRALYRAYGTGYPFCSYYISEDGCAAAVLFHSSLFFSDIKYRSLFWEDSLAALPVSNISSDTPLDMDGYASKTGTFFQFDNTVPVQNNDILTYGDIDAAYRILREVFPDTFVQGNESEQKDFYMQWYCEMSHRIRHGVTDVAILDGKATATVYCIEENAVFFSQVGVLPGLRGGGYGRRLLTGMMQKYAGKRCYVFSKNPNADRFYTALGFTPAGSWQDYIRKD